MAEADAPGAPGTAARLRLQSRDAADSGAGRDGAGNRRPAAPDNPFLAAERRMSDGIEHALDEYRRVRDLGQERMFKAIYGSPLVEAMTGLGAKGARHVRRRGDARLRDELAQAKLALLASKIEQGGTLEATLRALMYIFREDRRIVDERTFRMMERIRNERPADGRTPIAEVKDCVRDQAGILQIDEERAIRALPSLVSGEEERARVLDAIQRIAEAQGTLSPNAQARLAKVREVLGSEATGEPGNQRRRRRAPGMDNSFE